MATAEISAAGMDHDGATSERILPETIQHNVLSFLDACDILALMDALLLHQRVSSSSTICSPWFSGAASTKAYVGSLTSIHLSYLLRRYPNRLSDDLGQEEAVTALIEIATASASRGRLEGRHDQQQEPHRLHHLELANLRNVHGKRRNQQFTSSWLHKISTIPLVSLDLTNCHRLDEEFVLQYLTRCPTTLRHLNLSGCVRLGPRTVYAIGQRHCDLESASLGCCSQSIDNDSIRYMLSTCTKLQHIDLQGLTNILWGRSRMVIPDSVKSLNLSGCEKCFVSEEGNGELIRELLALRQSNTAASDRRVRYSFWKSKLLTTRKKLQYLYLNCTGSTYPPGHSIQPGLLSQFSLGMSLREVHLAGCHFSPFEIEALAHNCRGALTVFQMRAGDLCDLGFRTLIWECRKLAEIDVCACYKITNQGIVDAFTTYLEDEDIVRHQKRLKVHAAPSLRVLRLGSIPNITDSCLAAIRCVESLRILDVHDCPNISGPAVAEAVTLLPQLIEIDAKGVQQDQRISKMLRETTFTPETLRFVNQRSFSRLSDEPRCELNRQCCTVRTQSQRLSGSVSLRPMYHCGTCSLIPQIDRGVCGTCIKTCHGGHDTFLGSFTRYYCDCAFDYTPGHSCKAFMLPTVCGSVDAFPAST